MLSFNGTSAHGINISAGFTRSLDNFKHFLEINEWIALTSTPNKHAMFKYHESKYHVYDYISFKLI